MNSRMNFLLGCMASSMLFGCITTDTGSSIRKPSDDAAEQNYQLGAQYFRKGNFSLARQRLETAIEFDPRYADAYSLLAMTMVQLDNKRLAIAAFDKAVRFEPNNIHALNAYAVFLCQERDFDAASKHFDRAIKNRENDNAEVMMTNAGVCMGQKPDYALAEKYFRDALLLKPTYGEALIQLSALMHVIGDDLKARAFLQRFLVTNKESAAVLYLGYQIETALDDERAANDYKSLIFTDFPDSAEATQLMALRP